MIQSGGIAAIPQVMPLAGKERESGEKGVSLAPKGNKILF